MRFEVEKREERREYRKEMLDVGPKYQEPRIMSKDYSIKNITRLYKKVTVVF